jgi:cell division septation protein DedD
VVCHVVKGHHQPIVHEYPIVRIRMYLYKGVACIGTNSIRGGIGKVKVVSSLLRPLSCRTSTGSTSSCPPRTRTFGSVVSTSSSSTMAATTTALLYPDAVIHSRGDLPYGSREYLLLPPHTRVTDLQFEPKLLLASIRAHRNILFDCRMMMSHPSNSNSTSQTLENNASIDDDDNHGIEIEQPQVRLVHVCLPLVQAALQDAGSQGEQPQAVSTLHGLSSWVVECLEGRQQSQVLNNLQRQAQSATSAATSSDDDDDKSAASASAASAASIALGAVRAIATGIPRLGHSVVGVGTYRDGQVAWQALAKEYVHLSRSSSSSAAAASTAVSTTEQQQEPNNCFYGSQESELYQAAGGQLVGIEHLADQQPAYLKSAGGAMARFFFL